MDFHKMKPSQTKKLISTILVSGSLLACASNPGNYDPNAMEILGRVSAKKTAGTFSRTVGPLTGDSTLATGGYLGWIVANKLFSQQSTVTLFEYTVKLEDGRTVTVLREWGSDELGACVRVFESPTKREDYPRMTSAGGCRQ